MDAAEANARPPTVSNLIGAISAEMVLLSGYMKANAGSPEIVLFARGQLFERLPRTLRMHEFRNMTLLAGAYIIQKEVLREKNYQVFFLDILTSHILGFKYCND